MGESICLAWKIETPSGGFHNKWYISPQTENGYSVTGRSSILLNKIFLVTESSLLGTLRTVYARRRHLYSDGLRTTEYTAVCFV